MDADLLVPDQRQQDSLHKLKRLVQRPNSYFIDIKCKVCKTLNHTFSHAQSEIRCKNCNELLAVPTGGKLELMDGCHVRRKAE